MEQSNAGTASAENGGETASLKRTAEKGADISYSAEPKECAEPPESSLRYLILALVATVTCGMYVLPCGIVGSPPASSLFPSSARSSAYLSRPLNQSRIGPPNL